MLYVVISADRVMQAKSRFAKWLIFLSFFYCPFSLSYFLYVSAGKRKWYLEIGRCVRPTVRKKLNLNLQFSVTVIYQMATPQLRGGQHVNPCCLNLFFFLNFFLFSRKMSHRTGVIHGERQRRRCLCSGHVLMLISPDCLQCLFVLFSSLPKSSASASV